jgi:hypothetical protein
LAFLNALVMILEITNFGFKFKYVFFKEAQYFNFFYYLMRCVSVYSIEIMDSNKQNIIGMILKNYWIFLGFFLFKFLDWRFNQQIQTEIKLSSNFSKINPPKLNKKNVKNICPLCHKLINIPSFVPTSNSLYCFPCISDFVEKNGRCPATNLNLEINDVRKIYLN